MYYDKTTEIVKRNCTKMPAGQEATCPDPTIKEVVGTACSFCCSGNNCNSDTKANLKARCEAVEGSGSMGLVPQNMFTAISMFILFFQLADCL